MLKQYTAFGFVLFLFVSDVIGMQSVYERRDLRIKEELAIGVLWRWRLTSGSVSGYCNEEHGLLSDTESEVDIEGLESSDEEDNNLRVGYTVQCGAFGCTTKVTGWEPGTIRVDLERHRFRYHMLCSIRGHVHNSKRDAEKCLRGIWAQYFPKRRFVGREGSKELIDVLQGRKVWKVKRRLDPRNGRWSLIRKVRRVSYQEIVKQK